MYLELFKKPFNSLKIGLKIALASLRGVHLKKQVLYISQCLFHKRARQSHEQFLYSQTPLLRTPLGPEKVSVLRGVLIKRVNFKENV